MASGCFRQVNQEGKAGPLPAPAGATGWAAEESLDLDIVSAGDNANGHPQAPVIAGPGEARSLAGASAAGWRSAVTGDGASSAITATVFALAGQPAPGISPALYRPGPPARRG